MATPDAIAAFATAGAMRRISRGSNGLGISEPGPNPCVSPLSKPGATASDGGSRASCAIASTAAFFISSLIAVAPTSSAPRKMKGKHRTLLTWLGKSERPVQIIASGRALRASSGMISGFGLASAITSGLSAIALTMSGVSTLGADSPRKMSAPPITSASTRLSVFCA